MDDKALSFLMFRAIRGVISNAESGDLPLFASTLGLPAHQYCYRQRNTDPPSPT